MDTLTTETNKTETKKPKVSKKTKKSDQITEKTTEIIKSIEFEFIKKLSICQTKRNSLEIFLKILI